MPRIDSSRILLTALLMLLLSCLVPGQDTLAQESQSWSTLKSTFQTNDDATRMRTPYLLQHPVYGFGFGVEPGITGQLVDQICLVAAQAGVDLYALDTVRFEFGPDVDQYLFLAIGDDGEFYAVLVDLGSNTVIESVHSVSNPAAESAVLYDSTGRELGEIVGEDVQLMAEKAVVVSLCEVMIAAWEYARDYWYSHGQDPGLGRALILAGAFIIGFCG